jgi:hypothetical protein
VVVVTGGAVVVVPWDGDVVGGTVVVVTTGGGVGTNAVSGGGEVGVASGPKTDCSIACAAGWSTKSTSPQGDT